MKETKKLLQRTGKILTAGIFLVLLVTGCLDGVFEPGGTGGNVTITIETEGRTVRPNDIANASIFDRIMIAFNKNGEIYTLTLNKPQTSGSINLERGAWNIDALGYIVIDGREYEAARGSSSVTVGAGGASVSISLRTGIFSGSPGVFSYNINYPANVSEAVLAITPLNDLQGHPVTITGNTVNLAQGKTGSFELLPGYYILNLTAKTGTNMMAVWNELVHIYSGQETAASHTFTAVDFTGTVALSGSVAGGELEDNHITGAVVTAYADANYINRIASVTIPNFYKMTASPFYYTGAWLMTVPSSFAGKNVYFRVEETLNGPAGTKNYIRDSKVVEVSANGNAGIDLGASFVWWKWIQNGNDNAVNYTVGQDGTVTITTTEAVENPWDIWQQVVGIDYPAENDLRYAYEFEAWTNSGTRPLSVQYIERTASETYLSKSFNIDTTHQSFVILSDTRIDSNTHPALIFQVGNTETGTLNIKIKSIKRANNYVPPDYENQPRFTATAESTGIRLKVDFRGLSMDITGVQFANETVGGYFQTYWNDPALCPETYEVIYPYVQAGKEYRFRLDWQGNSAMQVPYATVTAINGRGELNFANVSEIALIVEGNTLGYNKTPDIAPFIAANGGDITNPRYAYTIVSGTSWNDPAAIWRYGVDRTEPVSIDLTDLQNIPFWVNNISDFLGKTCFATASFNFNYNNDDIYPVPGTQKGSFSTVSISTPPFTYPNVIPGALTAVQHEEGVKLIVDLAKISQRTNSMQFHTDDWIGARLYMGENAWKNYGGEFYGQDTVEIVYPFVIPGKTYTFEVEFGSTNTKGQATITTTSGLGEMVISNLGNVGLIYNRNTKTLSSSTAPIEPTIADSPNITEKYWQWEFNIGINWNSSQYAGALRRDSPIVSVTFDETFDPDLGARLSEKSVFINPLYRIVYEGHHFQSLAAPESPSFIFPIFNPAVDTSITTAFDTNSNLHLSYNNYVYINQSNLNVQIYGYPYDASVSFAWYIDGVLQNVQTQTNYYQASVNLPISGLALGMHYGLVVVTIDGTAFAKEFSFRVQNY